MGPAQTPTLSAPASNAALRQVGTQSLGGDFGTTNTVIAVARPRAAVHAVRFRDIRELSDLYRSVLCFEHLSTSRHDVQAQAGIKAIRAYLTSIYETRFIQSFKSHIASPLFDETRIFGRGYKFEDLLMPIEISRAIISVPS